jgi:hypothetical protein
MSSNILTLYLFISDEGVAIKNKQIYLNLKKKKKWKTKCGISGSKSEKNRIFFINIKLRN